MSDDDLIRRGDAKAKFRAGMFDANAAHGRIDTLPAVKPELPEWVERAVKLVRKVVRENDEVRPLSLPEGENVREARAIVALMPAE